MQWRPIACAKLLFPQGKKRKEEKEEASCMELHTREPEILLQLTVFTSWNCRTTFFNQLTRGHISSSSTLGQQWATLLQIAS